MSCFLSTYKTPAIKYTLILNVLNPIINTKSREIFRKKLGYRKSLLYLRVR